MARKNVQDVNVVSYEKNYQTAQQIYAFCDDAKTYINITLQDIRGYTLSVTNDLNTLKMNVNGVGESMKEMSVKGLDPNVRIGNAKSYAKQARSTFSKINSSGISEIKNNVGNSNSAQQHIASIGDAISNIERLIKQLLPITNVKAVSEYFDLDHSEKAGDAKDYICHALSDDYFTSMTVDEFRNFFNS